MWVIENVFYAIYNDIFQTKPKHGLYSAIAAEKYSNLIAIFIYKYETKIRRRHIQCAWNIFCLQIRGFFFLEKKFRLFLEELLELSFDCQIVKSICTEK